ncbi:hypothetical protein BYT27DRAFT_7252744 [Phlegmacium glaucopus]|nr:hypothetical protein BYT27DRAFT_7252744 [Phlegmacium glaucopus]
MFPSAPIGTRLRHSNDGIGTHSFAWLSEPHLAPEPPRPAQSSTLLDTQMTVSMVERTPSPTRATKTGSIVDPNSLFHRPRLQQTSSQGTIDAVRCQSRRSSQEFQNPSLVVIGPLFASSHSRVQSDESSNPSVVYLLFTTQDTITTKPVAVSEDHLRIFLRFQPLRRLPPVHHARHHHHETSGPLYSVDWFPGKLHPRRHTTNEVLLPEVHMAPSTSARSGFKRIVSTFTRDIFKRLRSLKKSNPVSSPGLIEHADAPPGLRLLVQDNHGASCGGNK